MRFPIVHLGDLCEMDRQSLDMNDHAAARLPFVGVENVESRNGTIKLVNGSRTGNQRSTTFRFDERHILYAKLRPYLNKVATPDFAGRCSTELVPLLPRNGVDRQFVAHLLRCNQTVEYAMASVTGSRMPRADMKTLMSLPVPLPTLDEQRRIAGILNRAAKIERLRIQAQERLREFIPALFAKMFGDPAANPMEQDAAHCRNRRTGRDSGESDGIISFPVVHLGDLCEMDRQSLDPDDHVAARLPFVGVENVESQSGTIKLVNGSRNGNQRSMTFRFDERHILYAKLRPYLNKVATPDFAGRCSTELVPLLPRNGADRQFVAHLLRRNQTVAYAMASVTGSRMPRTDMKTFMSLPVPIPPLDKQRGFAALVRQAYRITEKTEQAAISAASLSSSLCPAY